MQNFIAKKLEEKDWKTILDVINVYDPSDIAHVYPEMATPEFMEDVHAAFKKVLRVCERIDHNKELINQQSIPNYE